jgi:pimeloyl-ACP methyl ester carboxylesterase
MSSSSTLLPSREGPGPVSGAPNLPAGFTDTFTSRHIDAGGLRKHAVIGGDGPPLLLVHGWPETWYTWRLLMPALARDFEVIAVDQRGIGLTDQPRDGYDSGGAGGDARCRWPPGTGHWVAETAPDEMLAVLTEFLAPYRDGERARRTSLAGA